MSSPEVGRLFRSLWLVGALAKLAAAAEAHRQQERGAPEAEAETDLKPKDRSYATHLLLLFALLILINLIVILGNILVILAVYATAKLRSVTNIFIVSLATADLLLGVFVLPYALMFEILDVWIFGHIWCRGWLVTDVWISTASILNLCAISVDRYVAVTRPVKYRSIMTPRKAKTIVASVWIVSFLICCPPLLPPWTPSGLGPARSAPEEVQVGPEMALATAAAADGSNETSRPSSNQAEWRAKRHLPEPGPALRASAGSVQLPPARNSHRQTRAPKGGAILHFRLLASDTPAASLFPVQVGAPAQESPAETRLCLMFSSDTARRPAMIGRRPLVVRVKHLPVVANRRRNVAPSAAVDLRSAGSGPILASVVYGGQTGRARLPMLAGASGGDLERRTKRVSAADNNNGAQIELNADENNNGTVGLAAIKTLSTDRPKVEPDNAGHPVEVGVAADGFRVSRSAGGELEIRATIIVIDNKLRKRLLNQRAPNNPDTYAALVLPAAGKRCRACLGQLPINRRSRKRAARGLDLDQVMVDVALASAIFWSQSNAARLDRTDSEPELDMRLLVELGDERASLEMNEEEHEGGCEQADGFIVFKAAPESIKVANRPLATSYADAPPLEYVASLPEDPPRPAPSSSHERRKSRGQQSVWGLGSARGRRRFTRTIRACRLARRRRVYRSERIEINPDSGRPWRARISRQRVPQSEPDDCLRQISAHLFPNSTTIPLALLISVPDLAELNTGEQSAQDGLSYLSAFSARSRRAAEESETEVEAEGETQTLARSRQGCALFDDKSYVIYSSLGSFYIPMLIMVFFYYRIYRVASRAQKAMQRGYMTTKWPLSGAKHSKRTNGADLASLSAKSSNQQVLASCNGALPLPAADGSGCGKELDEGEIADIYKCGNKSNSLTEGQLGERVLLRIHRREKSPTIALEDLASAGQQPVESGPSQQVGSHPASSARASRSTATRSSPPQFHLVKLRPGQAANCGAETEMTQQQQQQPSNTLSEQKLETNSPTSEQVKCKTDREPSSGRKRRHHSHHHRRRRCRRKEHHNGGADEQMQQISRRCRHHRCRHGHRHRRRSASRSGDEPSSVRITVSNYEDNNLERAKSSEPNLKADERPSQRLDRSHSCEPAPVIVLNWSPDESKVEPKRPKEEEAVSDGSPTVGKLGAGRSASAMEGSQASGLSLVVSIPSQVRKQSMILLSCLTTKSSQTLRRLSTVATHPVDSLLHRAWSRDDNRSSQSADSSEGSSNDDTEDKNDEGPTADGSAQRDMNRKRIETMSERRHRRGRRAKSSQCKSGSRSQSSKRTLDDYLMAVAGIDGTSSEDEELFGMGGAGDEDDEDEEEDENDNETERSYAVRVRAMKPLLLPPISVSLSCQQPADGARIGEQVDETGDGAGPELERLPGVPQPAGLDELPAKLATDGAPPTAPDDGSMAIEGRLRRQGGYYERATSRAGTEPVELAGVGVDLKPADNVALKLAPKSVKRYFSRTLRYKESVLTSSLDKNPQNAQINLLQPSNLGGPVQVDSSRPNPDTGRRRAKRTSRWHAKRLRAETKAAKTVAIIVGGFIFCWLPFFTAYLSRSILCERPDCIPQSLLSLFIWLGYLNSAINPVIYGLFSADFRHAFKNILCRCRFRGHEDTAVVSVLVDSIIKSIL